MKIDRGYKTELDPNNAQASAFDVLADARMFMFNVGLREWQRQYKNGEKPSAYSLKRQFTEAKRTIYADEFDWATIPFAVQAGAFRDIGDAFKHFFRRVKNGEKKVGYPKSQREATSFVIRNTRFEADRARLTSIGWVRLKEAGYIPTTDSGIKHGVYATVSKRAGRWYISVMAQEQVLLSQQDSTLIVGVDFGLKSLAVCSDGTVYENPRLLREAQGKLKRMQRELARRNRGGSNWQKTKGRLAKQHAKVADIRKHVLHQISHDIIVNKHPQAVVIEDLNVKGMESNHCLAQAIADVGFAELRRQIEYKAQWHGVGVLVADRWFPSSKTCSSCGSIKDNLTLSDRVYRCTDCGLVLDRDLNAAKNLAALGRNRQTGGDCLGS